uniref:Aurora-A binding domain-containing protein n=1 Tax=Chelydra serpentina TaxID=8475 RepID=A0A8C3SJC9_CHESE
MSHPPSSYSYVAETTYINFRTLNDNNMRSVDSWFDLKASSENVPPAENVATILQHKFAFSKANLPQGENHETEEREMVAAMLRSWNIVGSLAAWRVPSNDASALAPSGACQSRVSRRLSAQQKNAQQCKCQARVKAKRCTVTSTKKEDDPPTKKEKTYISSVLLGAGCSSNREKCTEVLMNRDHSWSTELCPARPKGKLTMPIMPTMQKGRIFLAS